jgi:hypothetical protein
MDDKLTIFIAVTAGAVVLQMLILAGMFFTMRKLSAHVTKLSDDLYPRLVPVLEQTKKLTSDVQGMLETTRPKLDVILDNAAVVSSTARQQTQKIDVALTSFMDRAKIHAIRADELVTRTFDRVEDTSSKVQNSVTAPFKQMNAVLQGIGVGLETLFHKSRQPRNGKQHDEMFI